jgi:hypothetical protein
VFQLGLHDVGREHASRTRRLFPVHVVRGVIYR